MESLSLEKRCQYSRRQSFCSQRDITGRAMAKHCSFKCIHVLAAYDNFQRYYVVLLAIAWNPRNRWA